MNTAQRFFTVTLLTFCFTTPVQAVRSPTDTNLEEINHHQAGATAALLLGDHTFLKQGEIAVSGHAYLSGWATDTLYGAWGLSLQAGLGSHLGVGLSYGYTDAQLHTRVWLLNAQYSPLSGPSPWLHLQAAVGHQFLDSSESGNVLIFEFDNPWPVKPGNPQILLDDMTWTHGYLNVLVNTQLWKFRPQASLGYVRSYYSWSGHEVPTYGGLEAGPGPAISDSGTIGTVTWALGLGLELGPVRPFVGLGAFSGGGLFLARMTIVF
ncbi:MAG: hypothetical protein KAH56_07790 [Candidatus Krumholzibacteria bacterium]|nr:hypothetical protein [Candidatus Krumholzibacteria bacterium]